MPVPVTGATTTKVPGYHESGGVCTADVAPVTPTSNNPCTPTILNKSVNKVTQECVDNCKDSKHCNANEDCDGYHLLDTHYCVLDTAKPNKDCTPK